jgi:asparagine synthase (glutamine-hydrolysing)
MCGITGFFDPANRRGETELRDITTRMASALIHRGPDDGGVWAAAEAGIGLGHRRLSIVDLSPQGHQPMISVEGRYVLVFNGEIYNFLPLRKELEGLGYGFRGHSDTEVLLAAFTHWGIEPAVQRFIGMFAFALWDRRESVLHLGRDRAGEKPLYYGWVGEKLLFGSELKALRAHPDWRAEVERKALALLMRYSYIPAPYSIYRGIYKLLPGTILTIPLAACDPKERLVPKPFWDPLEIARDARTHTFSGSSEEALSALETTLRETIRGQMIADVPLGAFLSGGIDSSLIVSLMQSEATSAVKTFTIGFHEAQYNEAEFAKAVARHLGTDHTELYVTPADSLAVIPKLPVLYDEPFADSSQIPTFLVSQLARQNVTVSLSGDAGDELFGGYNRYFWATSIWNKLGWVPLGLRKAAAAGITTVSPETWNHTFQGLKMIIPSHLQYNVPGDKLHKLAEILVVDQPEAIYQNLISFWKNTDDLVLNTQEDPISLTSGSGQPWTTGANFEQRMMFLDFLTYLPDDILVKVDRAAMGVSLETRVPFLDHRVIEFAWRLPLSMKIQEGKGKWILRQLLDKFVPRNLIERPKTGFGVPIDLWLRGPLKEWAEALLDERRLGTEGFFNAGLVRKRWLEHSSGARNWHYYLWPILMFQAWLTEETR